VPIKLEQKCSRCRRDDSIQVACIPDAMKVEETQKAREAKAQEIQAYLEAVPADLMPDVIAYVKGAGIVHTNICDPADAKRSCLKRVSDLVTAMGELDERKPRAKKAKGESAASAELV
jgi:hypothetical protein